MGTNLEIGRFLVTIDQFGPAPSISRSIAYKMIAKGELPLVRGGIRLPADAQFQRIALQPVERSEKA
jgi:hypothetical protein